LRVLDDDEKGTAEMNPDEHTGSDEDSDATISDNEDEASEDETQNREAETVTDAFKDARRLFPWQGRQKELAKELKRSIKKC
jgi:hypothetical protein